MSIVEISSTILKGDNMFKPATVLTSQTPFHYISFADGYYPTPATETALKSLVRCIKRREGTAIILGATGTGKSLLCNRLANVLVNDDICAITINNTNGCTPKALYQSILFELERPYLGMDENEMRLNVLDILTDPARYPAGLALIIDEAHNLPQETLEEIRQLSNGRTRRASGLSVTLCGDLRLEENLSHPRLESFQQRISTRVCLDPWSKKEVASYISTCLKAFKEKISQKSTQRVRKFSVEACDAVYAATNGVQRLVSQLCDQAYLAAIEQKKALIEADFIQSVWAQIQSLPDPVEDTYNSKSDDSCVEFGSLDDDSDWKSAKDDTDQTAIESDDDWEPEDREDESSMTDEEYNNDPFVQAVFGSQDTQENDDIEESELTSEEAPLQKPKNDSDRFTIHFDNLDKAEALLSKLTGAIPSANKDDDLRQPTPIPKSDDPINNSINRVQSIIDQLDKLEEYFTSYNTVDYVDSPLEELKLKVTQPEDARDEQDSIQTRFINPFDESFQQEEAVRRDEAHPVPPSPFAKNHEGTVSSAKPSVSQNKGVY